LSLRTSAMLIPDRPGAVGRFARRPTTDRGRMSSSKALVSRAATRIALLIVLDGAVAMREPLPVSTWHALEQRDWRIASTNHANSYLFRVDRGEAGGPGICPPRRSGPAAGARVGRVDGVGDTACRLDSAGRYAGATALPDPVDRRRLACASVRPLLRFPVQAHAGAGTSGPDATFLLGNLLVRRPVRATSLDP
jgi:hypothetical protein